MDGYMAEKRPEYKMLIGDKIKNEITTSTCLVAIITTNSRASASVHEEIGFAMGKSIEVLLMIEKSKELKGVLTYGREPKRFTEASFVADGEDIALYIREEISEKTNPTKISMDDYILSRNLHDQTSDDFCKNDQTNILKPGINHQTASGIMPFILFSAWPHNKVTIPVQEPKIAEFLNTYKRIEIENNHVHFLDNYDERELESLVYYNNSPSSDQRVYGINPDITRYLELQTNGFLEQGISKKIINQVDINGMLVPSLHHCWLTGAFWAFLKFTKMYYEFNGMNEKFDVVLSIRNSGNLMLHGFGGKTNGARWGEPDEIGWYTKNPSTKQRNIQLKLENLDLEKMTDEHIKSEVRTISDRIAYAYGMKSARCYNNDSSFNWELMAWYSHNL